MYSKASFKPNKAYLQELRWWHEKLKYFLVQNIHYTWKAPGTLVHGISWCVLVM